MNKRKVIEEFEHLLIAAKENYQDFVDLTVDGGEEILALLKEHEPKQGHWTTHRTNQHDGEWYCDQCDYEPTVYESMPYCPNCGARMEQGK